MEPGGVLLGHHWMNFDWSLLFTKVVFRMYGGRGDTIVVGYGRERPAALCPRCGGIWIGAAA
jgi:hypothetical protein